LWRAVIHGILAEGRYLPTIATYIVKGTVSCIVRIVTCCHDGIRAEGRYWPTIATYIQ
jgi:hypothetical protein